jgi:hypothetical protein
VELGVVPDAGGVVVVVLGEEVVLVVGEVGEVGLDLFAVLGEGGGVGGWEGECVVEVGEEVVDGQGVGVGGVVGGGGWWWVVGEGGDDAGEVLDGDD